MVTESMFINSKIKKLMSPQNYAMLTLRKGFSYFQNIKCFFSSHFTNERHTVRLPSNFLLYIYQLYIYQSYFPGVPFVFVPFGGCLRISSHRNCGEHFKKDGQVR